MSGKISMILFRKHTKRNALIWYLFLLREQFMDCCTKVFHDYSPKLLNRLLVSVCGWTAWACLALHWGSAKFEVVVQFLNRSFVHGNISKCMLNLLDDFRLSMLKNSLSMLKKLPVDNSWCSITARCVWSYRVKTKIWWARIMCLYSRRN